VSSPRDWALRDRRDGCARNTPLDCVTDKFYAVQQLVRSLPHGAVSVQAAASRDGCAQVCLTNCSCTAYSYGEGGCSVWHGKLYSVVTQQQQQPDASSSSDGNGDVLYIRLAAKDVPDVGRKKKKIGFGIAAASAAAFLGLLIILGLVIWKTKGRKKATENAQGGIGIIAFRYADLQHATKNFSEKLGAAVSAPCSRGT